MSEKRFKAPEGSCIISEEVIVSIASSAALEVPGVAGMAPRMVDIRGFIGAASGRAVRVLNNENMTVIDVYVKLNADAHIPEVGTAVQHSVKVAVQSMTGKPVNKVNVHVAGVVPSENEPAVV